MIKNVYLVKRPWATTSGPRPHLLHLISRIRLIYFIFDTNNNGQEYVYPCSVGGQDAYRNIKIVLILPILNRYRDLSTLETLLGTDSWSLTMGVHEHTAIMDYKKFSTIYVHM